MKEEEEEEESTDNRGILETQEGERVTNGEKESQGWSRMEKYEWVLGVCILDWGRPPSDRERCGCSQR